METFQESVINTIQSCMPKPLQNMKVEFHHRLAELGIDSLAFMTLSIKLESAFGIPLSERIAELTQARTVEDIVRILSAMRDA